MPWILVSERVPEFKGWHLCRIGGRNGERRPLMISRADLIVGPDGKCYNSWEVEYFDESGPNQEELWDEVERVIDDDLREAYEQSCMISSVAMDLLKQTYTLIRK